MLVQRFASLIISLSVHDDMSESEWEEYMLYKKYRTSESVGIRIVGRVLDTTDFISMGVIRSFPFGVGVFALLVLIYVVFEIFNT